MRNTEKRDRESALGFTRNGHASRLPVGAFLYAAVFDLLNSKIASHALPSGAVLKEGSIATQLGVSRAPVRRALQMLSKQKTIREASGQGYVVGNGEPTILSSRALHDILVVESDDLDRQASWERIFFDVQDNVTACLPFGHYRILEAELGEAFGVSRTVAREVLWRLTDRRLIAKDRKSHWVVSQLSARDIRDSFEMRQLLEPRALARVAEHLDCNWLERLAAQIDVSISRFPDCDPIQIDAIEQGMFHTMYNGLRNSRMLGSLRSNQISLVVPRLFRQHFPLRDDLDSLKDCAQILEHLLDGTVDTACMLLEAHLLRVEPVTLARLRVLSVLPPPPSAPYLIPIHQEDIVT